MSDPSLYGSNSSHSESNEHRTGGRTYHLPNYATSYANNRTNLITIVFNEGKTSPSHVNWVHIAVTFIFAFFLLTAVPFSPRAPTSRTWSQYFRVNLPSNLASNFMPMKRVAQLALVHRSATNTDPHPSFKFGDFCWDKPRSPHCRGHYGNREHTTSVWDLPGVLSDLLDSCCSNYRDSARQASILRNAFLLPGNGHI